MRVLYVDADACPVKAEAQQVALRHGWAMVLVSNGGIRPVDHPLVQTVYVPDGLDVADVDAHPASRRATQDAAWLRAATLRRRAVYLSSAIAGLKRTLFWDTLLGRR